MESAPRTLIIDQQVSFLTMKIRRSTHPLLSCLGSKFASRQLMAVFLLAILFFVIRPVVMDTEGPEVIPVIMNIEHQQSEFQNAPVPRVVKKEQVLCLEVAAGRILQPVLPRMLGNVFWTRKRACISSY